MRLTVPHLADFGDDTCVVGDDLRNAGAWDALRTKTTGPYAMPRTRAALEAQLDERPDLSGRAVAIDGWAEANGDGALASYGAGTGLLELALHRRSPRRRIVASDNAPEAVAKLGELVPEIEMAVHDLSADAPLEVELHLFHRIDTEFDDAGWRAVFERFRDARVLVVPGGVINVRRAVHELRTYRGRRRRQTRAGWLRTRASLESLWARTHTHARLQVHDLDAWSLTPRTDRAGA
jgi:hypothetical protein